MKRLFNSLALGLTMTLIGISAQHVIILTMHQTEVLSPTALMSSFIENSLVHNVDMAPDTSYNPFTDTEIPDEYKPYMVDARNKQHAVMITDQLIAYHQSRDTIRRSPLIYQIAARATFNLIDPLLVGTNIITGGVNFVGDEKRRTMDAYIDHQYYSSCITYHRPPIWCSKIGERK